MTFSCYLNILNIVYTILSIYNVHIKQRKYSTFNWELNPTVCLHNKPAKKTSKPILYLDTFPIITFLYDVILQAKVKVWQK